MIVNYVLIALFLINFKCHLKELTGRSLIREYAEYAVLRKCAGLLVNNRVSIYL